MNMKHLETTLEDVSIVGKLHSTSLCKPICATYCTLSVSELVLQPIGVASITNHFWFINALMF